MTRAISVFAGLILTAALGHSSSVTFIDRTTWEANVSNESTTTFDTSIGGYTAPQTDSFVNLGYGVLTINGIQFSSYAGGAQWQQFATHYSSDDWGSGAILKADTTRFNMTSEFVIGLPSNTFAFGVDLMTDNLASSYHIVIDGVDFGNVSTYARPQRAFFGVTSSTAMQTVELLTSTNNVNPALDNFSVGTPGAAGTPEGQTFLLCATGLLTLARLRKHFHL